MVTGRDTRRRNDYWCCWRSRPSFWSTLPRSLSICQHRQTGRPPAGADVPNGVSKEPLLGSRPLAERAGFEPAVALTTPLFESGTINHSDTSPSGEYRCDAVGFSLVGDVRVPYRMIKCDGFGHCAELIPERIRLDRWGYPIVDGQPVPPDLAAHARRAVSTCPLLALRLENAD